MIISNMAGDSGRTPPTYHSMGSPRYGGCVGTFFHIFDWNPAKRFSSTKRLSAGKLPEKTMQRSRSSGGDRGDPDAKPLKMLQIRDAERATELGGIDRAAEIRHGEDASIRAPGVVARLMGLESLPEISTRCPQPHRRCQSYTGGGKLPSLAYMDVDRDVDSDGTLVLFQDLLKRSDFKRGRRTLRDRMPGFGKQAQKGHITRRGVQDEETTVSAFVDIPEVQRRIVGNYSKPTFLSQLTSSQRTVPLLPSKLHTPRGSPGSTMRKRIPELALQLQAIGWPLAGPHGRMIRGLDHESSTDDVSFRSESDSLCTECANEIRRGSPWNAASEGSDSTNEQQEFNPGSGSLPRHQNLTHRKLETRKPTTLKKTSSSPSPSPSPSSEQRLRNSVSTKTCGISPKLATLRTGSSPILSSREDDRSQTLENSGTNSASVESDSTASPTSDLTDNSTLALSMTTSEPSAKTRRPRPKFTRTTETNIMKLADHGKSVSKAVSTPHGKLDGYRLLKMRSLLKVGQRGSSRKLQAAVTNPSSQKEGDELMIQVGECQEIMDDVPTLGEQLGSLSSLERVEALPMTVCDERQGSASSLSRSLDRMFEQTRFDHFTDCEGGGDWSSSSGLIGNCGDANAPVDDLTWVPDEIGEQRVRGGSCSERSCSDGQTSVSSVSDDDASDVDDERDAWSSCASYNPADSDSPKTFELPDTDADSDLPEQKLEKPVEKISEESDGTMTATSVEQQPSPVSILNSPFHDEACTTSESSLIDSHRQCFNLDEDVFKSYNDNDKIRLALLDISMFQSLEVFTFDFKERITPSGGPKEEQSFVQEILSAAQFLSTPGSSPNWFNRDLAIDPSLFDRLELSGEMDHAEDDDGGPGGGVEKFQVTGGLWRCDRKLLFDCVNEAFAMVPRRFRGSEIMGLQQRPRGQKLVETVYKKIEEWRKLPSHGFDDLLIERDMCIDFGSWKDFSAEVAEVALDIENVLWKAIVEEAVVDILSTAKHS